MYLILSSTSFQSKEKRCNHKETHIRANTIKRTTYLQTVQYIHPDHKHRVL